MCITTACVWHKHPVTHTVRPDELEKTDMLLTCNVVPVRAGALSDWLRCYVRMWHWRWTQGSDLLKKTGAALRRR